jgi:uracil-DNA glycosylase family 4
MFTGDRSGDWLYRALHRADFATQAEAFSADDGLVLRNCAITAVAHCAPPDNKPSKDEITNCRPYLQKTFSALPVKVVLALGGIAWSASVDYLLEQGWWSGRRPQFSHGAAVRLQNGCWLVGSYHPSQQNTFTGRLTEPMFDSVFTQIHKILKN